MRAAWGWSLAVLALAIGTWRYGWPGLLLAVTMIVFWLLLQFSRAMRVMRMAAGAPVGHVASAVMLHTQLHPGIGMMEVVKLTRSLGRKLRDDPEAFVWRDDGGDEVEVEFANGRCQSWRLNRRLQ